MNGYLTISLSTYTFPSYCSCQHFGEVFAYLTIYLHSAAACATLIFGLLTNFSCPVYTLCYSTDVRSNESWMLAAANDRDRSALALVLATV